jgi:hypothetical protein
LARPPRGHVHSSAASYSYRAAGRSTRARGRAWYVPPPGRLGLVEMMARGRRARSRCGAGSLRGGATHASCTGGGRWVPLHGVSARFLKLSYAYSS